VWSLRLQIESGLEAHLLCMCGVSGPWQRAFQVLPGERTVDIRVLVDRSVVEVWVAGGRATLQGRSYAAASHTAVHIVAPSGESHGSPNHLVQKQPVTVANYSIHSMGCGWL
jgi:hypothetical protein